MLLPERLSTTGPLDPADRDLLLHTAAAQLVGRILALNRTGRYHNSLDAIALACQLLHELPADPASGSSADIPVPSDPARAERNDGSIFAARID